MLVTDIIPVNKTKFKIYIDEEIAFVLYKGDLSKYNLKIGSDVAQEVYDNLYNTILPSRCYNRVLGIFKTKDYTSYEIKSKLSGEGYPAKIIEDILDRLSSERFIDDYRYAVGYIRDKSKKKSLMTIKRDLQAKGISSSIFESAFCEVKEDGDLSDETECIKKLLIKRKFDANIASFEDKQKTVRYLMSKGFKIDSINKVVKSFEIGYTE